MRRVRASVQAKVFAALSAQAVLLAGFLTIADMRGIAHPALVGLGGLTVGIAFAWAIGRALSRRLDDDSADEVGQLARSFSAIAARNRALLEEIHDANAREKEKEKLETLLRLRTREFQTQSRDMRTVLDNVGQGFFTLDRDGAIGPEHSRVLETWFRAPGRGESLWSYLGGIDEVLGWRVKVGWDAVVEDVLPLELALDQMPKGFTAGGRHFSIEVRPIQEIGPSAGDEAVSQFLVMISDVTSAVEREKAGAAEHELLAILEHVARDRAGFVAFLAEGESLVARIVASTVASADVRRWIHTLKGNASVFGLLRLAQLCHAVEDHIGAGQSGISAVDRAQLAEQWGEISRKLATFVRDASTDRIEIRETEYRWLLDGLVEGVSRTKLAREVTRWRLEPGHRPFERLAEQARAIAARLGKGNVKVVTNANELRFDPSRWAPFWSSLVHMLRNAMDHGIEPAAERLRAGKPADGTIAIVAVQRAEAELVVEVSDDGRGIDWEKVVLAAQRAGIHPTSAAEMEELLFADGLSTRAEVDMVSGRGMGLAAARSACQALGGQASVSSNLGEGTTFSFSFPASAAFDDVDDASPNSVAA